MLAQEKVLILVFNYPITKLPDYPILSVGIAVCMTNENKIRVVACITV